MKSEIRNPTVERGPKSDGRKKTGSRRPHFRHLGFRILSGFGFRVSGLASGWLAAGAGLLFAAAPGVRAQQNGVQHANNFTSTEYYGPPHQQQIKSTLSGAEALPQPGGLLIVKQLKLEMFSLDGKLEWVVNAPECVYDTFKGVANSPGHLEVRSGDGKFRVEGNEGFLWRQSDNFLTISNNQRTVIENGAKMNTKP
jgi:hypothetical protein